MINASRLARFELLADLDAHAIAEIAAACTARDVPAGDLVFTQGDIGGDLYLLESGEVEVVIESREERHGIARIQPGSFFGEVGFLNSGPRTASIVAIRPTVIIAFEQHSFDAMVDAGSVAALRIARRLASMVAHRMRSTSRFVSRVLESHEQDYQRPMSGAFLPEQLEEIVGDLPVRHARSLDHNDLLDLFEGRVLALRIPTWYPRWLCEKIARRLLKHPGFARYLMAQDVGVQRIGMTLFETENQDAMLERYYGSAQETMWSMRRHCFPYLTPVERLRLELDELWPSGAKIESLHGRKMLCGVARMFEDSHSLPPHQDVLVRDVPESARAGAQKCQIAMNCYIRAPREGGELELWDINPTEAEYEAMRAGQHDFLDRAKMPLSTGKIRPQGGELLLMRSDRVHAVHACQGGPRMSVSCFIGYYGPDEPISFWS